MNRTCTLLSSFDIAYSKFVFSITFMAIESDFEKDDNEGGRGDLSHATVVGARTSYSQTADTTSSQQASGSGREGERDRKCLDDIDIVKSSVNTSATASSSAFFSGKNDEKQNRYDSYYMSMTADENSKLNNQNRSVRSWDRVDGQTVDKISCLMESYENLLESQLLDQQIYFEKKLARETILALEESLRRRKCMAAATVDSNRPVGDAIMKNSRRNDGKCCNNNISSLRNCKSVGNRPTSDDIVMSSNADSVRAGDWISSAPRQKVASNINQSETVNYEHTDDYQIDYNNDNDTNNKNNNNNDNHNNNDDNCNDDGDDDYNNNFHNNNHYNNDNDEYNSMSPTDYEAIDEQLARVEISKIEISSLEHEYSIILSNLKDIELENKIMRKNNEILIKEQKKLREHVEQLNNSEEETKRKCEEEVNELEQQIRDLCFYTKMKNQVASSPLRDELEGGSVVMPISTSLPIPPSLLQSQSQSGVQHMAVPQGSKKKSVTIPLKKSK